MIYDILMGIFFNMSKISLLKKYLYSETFLQNLFWANNKRKFHHVIENKLFEISEKEKRRDKFFLNDWNVKRDALETNRETAFYFSPDFIFETDENVLNEKKKEKKLLFWNRAPGAKYPKKANNGARPDCRSLRKIRKRLKTGK